MHAWADSFCELSAGAPGLLYLRLEGILRKALDEAQAKAVIPVMC